MRVRISGGGQISIPAAVRRRWGTGELELFDEGDHLVLRPAGDGDPVAAARGALAGRTSAELRRAARRDEAGRVDRR